MASIKGTSSRTSPSPPVSSKSRTPRAGTATLGKPHIYQEGRPAINLVNLQKWITANAKYLQPPVSNKQLFVGSSDVIVFVSGGPNTRNDFHINPTEELFYQLKGDIAVRIRPLDGSKPTDVVIKEGELYLLPKRVPHRPQRPKGTVGLIVEFPRPKGQFDGLRWYCPKCDELVCEVQWLLNKIDEDLRHIMHGFWDGPVVARTCSRCGYVIERAGAIEVNKGKVRPASGARKTAAKKRR